MAKRTPKRLNFWAAALCGRAAFFVPARERLRLCNIIVA